MLMLHNYQGLTSALLQEFLDRLDLRRTLVRVRPWNSEPSCWLVVGSCPASQLFVQQLSANARARLKCRCCTACSRRPPNYARPPQVRWCPRIGGLRSASARPRLDRFQSHPPVPSAVTTSISAPASCTSTSFCVCVGFLRLRKSSIRVSAKPMHLPLSGHLPTCLSVCPSIHPSAHPSLPFVRPCQAHSTVYPPACLFAAAGMDVGEVDVAMAQLAGPSAPDGSPEAQLVAWTQRHSQLSAQLQQLQGEMDALRVAVELQQRLSDFDANVTSGACSGQTDGPTGARTCSGQTD
jgi:hypothetical protein